MFNAPALWGAALASALGGAIAGNALGSVQPIDRSVLTEMYQSHPSTTGYASGDDRPPDHYPLVTRAGTVPVAELATRGLYRQARYQPRVYAANYGGYEPAVETYQYDEGWSGHTEMTAPTSSASPEPPKSAADGALRLAAEPATLSVPGAAKTIDVGAALTVP